ncbi:MAG: disulfide bond formation protein B [Acetobacteraceae bacterium]|nr:disulfide bond formation protein B [Acetobacteraceae bacterium]
MAVAGDGILPFTQEQLAPSCEPAHIAGMRTVSLRPAALACVLAAAAALAFAFSLEIWGGIVPCALCLVERWPYRVALGLGLVALVMPTGIARLLLWLAVATVLADAAIAFVHVGVEAGWWPSPLPECAAPRLASGSIAERLASMPAHPAKPCDDATYLVPGVPVSLAMANMLFALVFAAALSSGMDGRRRRR